MTIREMQDAYILAIEQAFAPSFVETMPAITNYDTGLRITIADLRANEYPEYRDWLEFHVLAEKEA